MQSKKLLVETKDKLKKLSDILTLVKYPIYLVPLLLILCQGCVSRKKIEAAIWLNNFPPQELCAKNPELHEYGFYRKLNNGKFEFVSICKEEARLYLTMYKDHFDNIMQEAFGTKSKELRREN